MTNLQELTAGGTPDLSGSPPRILLLRVESGQLRCVWSTLPGRAYQLQIRQPATLGAACEWQNSRRTYGCARQRDESDFATDERTDGVHPGRGQ